MVRSQVHIIIFTILLSSLACPGQAQEKKGKWYGGAYFSLGSDFDTDWYDLMTIEKLNRPSRSNGSVGGNVGWKSDKWNISATVRGSSTYHMTSFSGVSYKYSDKDTTINVDLSQQKQIKSEFTAGTNISYIAGPSDVLGFQLYHNQEHQNPYNASGGAKSGDTLSAQSQEENGTYMKYAFHPRLTWNHTFLDKKKSLFSSLAWNYANDDRYTVWTMFSGRYDADTVNPIDSTQSSYRITPKYIDRDLNLLVKYTGQDFCRVKNLNLEFSLNAIKRMDKDEYSGANLIEEHWEDSTRLAESFRYVSATVEPRVRATYSIGQFRFDWTFNPQYFTDRLTTTTDDERFDAGRVDALWNLQSRWIPGEHHNVGITYVKTIKRADYLQMCWFMRPGVFSNELRKGNPSLLPTSEYRLCADYLFSWDRFSSTLEAGYKRTYDRIEQTYNIEELEQGTFRVYTWVNAGQSVIGNVKAGLKWSGKIISASMSANVNHFIGYSADGSRSTSSNDMEVNAGISANLPWKINISGNGKYQSAITRVYGSMSSYISCNAKISKSFKRLNLYVEGRDLLDKPITVGTFSEDGKEGRYEERKNNRQLFIAGLGISF